MRIQLAVKTTFYVIIYFKFRYQWTKIPFYFMGIAIGVFIYFFYRILLHQGFKSGNTL